MAKDEKKYVEINEAHFLSTANEEVLALYYDAKSIEEKYRIIVHYKRIQGRLNKKRLPKNEKEFIVKATDEFHANIKRQLGRGYCTKEGINYAIKKLYDEKIGLLATLHNHLEVIETKQKEEMKKSLEAEIVKQEQALLEKKKQLELLK